MDTVVRDEREHAFGGPSSIEERRKLNWSAIWAGVVATIGLQVLFTYFWSALGLSVWDVAAADTDTGSKALPLIVLFLTVIVTAFFGAWVTGRWANLFRAGDAEIHGALTWALYMILAAAGLGMALQVGANTAQAGSQVSQAAPQQMQLTPRANSNASDFQYNALQDQNFTSFLLNQAQSWKQQNPQASEEAMNVSADNTGKSKESAKKEDHDKLVTAKDVSGNDKIEEFVSDNANMSKDSAEKFVKQNAQPIADAQNRSFMQWRQQHQPEIQAAKQMKESASTVAWVAFGLALVSLAAAVGGSYFGWYGRYDHMDDDDDLYRETRTTSGTPTV